MRKGDIMSITSHVNFSGFGPLDDVGVGGGNVVNRVPECVYSQRLMKHAKETGLAFFFFFFFNFIIYFYFYRYYYY